MARGCVKFPIQDTRAERIPSGLAPDDADQRAFPHGALWRNISLGVCDPTGF